MRRGPAGGGERRAHRRVPLRLDVAYEDVAGALFLRLRDLSESGVLLEGSHRPPLGIPVRLVLELPGEPALERLSGRVVRRVAPERGGPAFAVAFDSSATHPAIGRTVERALGWRRAS